MDFYEKVLKDAEETARYLVECGHLSQEDAEQMFPGLREHVPYSDNELNEAAEEFAEAEWDGLHDNDGNPLYTEDYIQYTFKAGAEWAINHATETQKDFLADKPNTD